MKSSRINTFITNVETGEEFHLALEIPSSGPTMGHSSNEAAAAIKHHDEAEDTLVKGTLELVYLWYIFGSTTSAQVDTTRVVSGCLLSKGLSSLTP